MLLSKVLGVIVIARNGDRFNYYQDPLTYAGSNTETTALGEVILLSSSYSLTVDTPLVRPSPTFWAPLFVPHTSTAALPHTLRVFAPIWLTTMKSRSASRPEWKAQSFSTPPFLCSKVFSHPTRRTRSFLPTKPLLLRLWVDISMFQVSYECCSMCTFTHLLFLDVQLKLWNLATIALWKAGPTAL